VRIGENSIVGAGSVVTSDIPANVIAAGNPARVIKELDPDREIITRKDRFSNTDEMTRQLEDAEKHQLKGNSLLGWIQSLFFPRKEM
jgi:carbonic anhydrase/acetyltransferase-like protein (isoleucine patch superfamily)